MKKLPQGLKAALEHIRQNPGISSLNIMDDLGLSVDTTIRRIKDLMKLKLIHRRFIMTGMGRRASYYAK